LQPKVLADYIDVFCDRGFFTVEETDRILLAGLKYGLRAKIHANELDYSGGVQVGVKYNALSVDHLEYTGDERSAACWVRKPCRRYFREPHFSWTCQRDR